MSAPLGAALRAEWIKLRSVRSTYITVGIALLLGLGIGLLDVISTVHNWSGMNAADRASFDPVGNTFSGFQFGELAFGALGVLAISTEYGTDLIRTTLVTVPSRRLLYTAKVLVLSVFALIVCETCAFSAFLLGQAVLSHRNLDVGLAHGHVLRAVGFAGLYMMVVTMVGFGLGAIIRHTAGAIAAMVAIVFLAWPAARAVESFSSLPDRMLLINAADALTATHPATGLHTERIPSFGFACLDLIVYLAVFLGIAAWRFTRDA